MTPETVVRRYFDLVAARDLEALAEILDPEVLWLGTRGGLEEHRVIRGPDACVAYLREIHEPWDRFTWAWSVERLIENDDTVVAFLREATGTRGGDLEVTNETAIVFTVRAQRIVEATGYLNRDEALAAVPSAPQE